MLEKYYLLGNHIFRFITGKDYVVKKTQQLPQRRTELCFEDLPKSWIVCCDFHLTEDNKLMSSAKIFLKNRYAVLRESV